MYALTYLKSNSGRCFIVVALLVATFGCLDISLGAPLGYFPPSWYSNYRRQSPFWEEHKKAKLGTSQEVQLIHSTLKELSKAGIKKKDQDECIKKLSSLVSSMTKKPVLQPSAVQQDSQGGAGSTAQTLQHLASCCAASGGDDLAEEISRCSLHTIPQSSTAAPQRAESLDNLAGLAYRSGDCDNAIGLLNQAISIEESYSFKGPSGVGLLMNHLALCHARAGHYDESEKILKRALARDKERMGEKSFAIAEDTYNLAVTEMLKGDYPAANNYLEQARAMLRALPQDTGKVQQAWSKLDDELSVRLKGAAPKSQSEPHKP